MKFADHLNYLLRPPTPSAPDVTSYASVAYGTRIVVPTYSGPALQVRRTDNTLLDVGFATTEQFRSNELKNPTGVGGGVGVAPTGWVVNPGAGLTPSILGTGIENGTPYIDVRWSGTGNGQSAAVFFTGDTSTSVFDAATMTAAATGQSWTGSVNVRLIAGTGLNTANPSLRIAAYGGVTQRGVQRAILSSAVSNLPAIPRFASVYPSLPASVDRIHLWFDFFVTNGAVIDFTLRFSLPNLEQGKGHILPKSSVNVPTRIAAVGDLDVEAAFAHILAAANGESLSVPTWYDQSGKSRNATQATASNQPLLVDRGVMNHVGGKPSITSLGSVHNLVVSNWTLSGLKSLYADFVGVRNGTNSAPWASFMLGTGQVGGTGSTDKFNLTSAADAGTTFSVIGSSTLSTPTLSVSNVTPGIASVSVSSDNTARGYLDGIPGAYTSTGFISSGAFDNSALRIFGTGQGIRGWVGQSSEVVIYDTNIPENYRLLLEGKQSRVYGVTSSPVAVFSLRRLYGSGPVIRVRRDSDDAESDFGTTASGELDLATLMSFIGNANGFVTVWYDQLSSYNASQTLKSNQPRIVTSGVLELMNRKPAVRFTAASGTCLVNSSVPNANAISRNIVFRADLSSDSQYPLATGGSISPRAYVSSSGRINLGSTLIGTSIPANTPAVVTGTAPGGGNITQSQWINGSVTTGSTTRTGSTPGIGIGAFAVNNAGFTGHVSEVTCFSVELPTSDRQLLEREQGAYYSISVA